MESSNKRIAVNTVIIYAKMIFSAIISFFTSRYILAALGVSDYGLYNVVGGVVAMLNFISIAMVTTTRRYVNVEMGKGDNGDINKIFNVCLLLHIGFAVFIYVVAMTIGIWYVNNVLNVSAEKLSDARFVYIISTSVSALGIINVPYQALMAAYERFKQIAIIDLLISCLSIPLVVSLLLYSGNHLRFFALGVCIITFLSFLSYFFYCSRNFKSVVKLKLFREINLYKEILIFNSYTSLGAFAYIGRAQGSTMVVNYFFGTVVNGAYAIATQIESQLQNFVGNLVTAANPQMTQSYSAGNYERSFSLVCRVSRYSLLFMILLTYSLYIEIDTILGIWLKEIPEGAILFCQAMLVGSLIRSFGGCVDPLIQATGKVKWYQIFQSLFLILGIPFALLFFLFNKPAVFIIYSFIICDIARIVVTFVIVCYISDFSFKRYARSVYLPIIKIGFVLFIYYQLYNLLDIHGFLFHIIGFVVTFAMSSIFSFYIGLTNSEQKNLLNKFYAKFNQSFK